MRGRLRDWLALTFGTAGLLAGGGAYVALSRPAPHERVGLLIAAWMGLALLIVAAIVALSRRRLEALLAESAEVPAARVLTRPRLTLLIASFVALFVELALIRYTGSQLRVFSFFKNVPLISAYLGLGLGCALGAGRARHVLLLLLWFLPFVVVLAAGAFLFSGPLGILAAAASSEQILGDAVVRSTSGLDAAIDQVGMGGFCVLTLVAIASLYVPIGRILGDAFERLPRLTAYSINIAGSLAGTAVFLLLGYLWTPPWVWLAVGLTPLLWWLRGRRQGLIGATLVALSAIAVAPRVGDTIWSPYQKLVGQSVKVPVNGGQAELEGYLVDISDVFYQVATDLRPSAVTRAGGNPFPHYDAAFQLLPPPIARVLIVGSGTGNDVAAALRAGAAAVDAVDIDPAIVSLGRQHHPEQPYADPRVRVIVEDARTAFRRLPEGSYDAVVFGLLDSHTQLGMSSLRLDNYVFTLQGFEEARSLVRPGGQLIVTAATFREWFRERLLRLLEAACGSEPGIEETPRTAWVTYHCRPVSALQAAQAAPAANTVLPTDDWPFLYLPERTIPQAYVLAVVLLVLGSASMIRRYDLSPARFTPYHGHLFFLGAGFLLMEVNGINRLALLFGTTWIVSAVAIIVVLTLILAANMTVGLLRGRGYAPAYAGLLSTLALSYLLPVELVLGRGVVLSVAYSFAVLLPVYFAGVIFARSFTRAPLAGPAIGANMLGAVVGGWVEYASMAVGVRAMVLLAMGFYAGSLLCLAWQRSSRSAGASAEADAGERREVRPAVEA